MSGGTDPLGLSLNGTGIVARRRELAKLILGNPPVLMDYIRSYFTVSARLARTKWRRLEAIAPSEARQHIASIIGDWKEGPALAEVRAWSSEAMGTIRADARRKVYFAGSSMAADTSLGELLYGLVRALRPNTVVETGVATGVTSAYVLAALADNGVGRLHSIDLPLTDYVVLGLVGVSVPIKLRDRWIYHWGTARRLLPRVLAGTHVEAGLFIHDSDHSYANMRWELQTAWDALPSGSWFVADDANHHSAFEDFAAAVGVQPVYVAQESKPDCAGLLRKQH